MDMVIYKSCHLLSGQQIRDTHHSIHANFMRVLQDERLVFINLPTRGWLITIRNDGISVNWDVVRGIPEFNHLLPGSHYCWPSSLSTARQLTRCPKFKQHAENMMENQRGAKHQSSPFPPAPQFQQLTILEQANDNPIFISYLPHTG